MFLHERDTKQSLVRTISGYAFFTLTQMGVLDIFYPH